MLNKPQTPITLPMKSVSSSFKILATNTYPYNTAEGKDNCKQAINSLAVKSIATDKKQKQTINIYLHLQITLIWQPFEIGCA